MLAVVDKGPALLVFAVGFVLAVALGIAVVRFGGVVGRRRLDPADRMVERVGRLWTGAVLALAGSIAVVIVSWPVGEVLAQLETSVDKPVFDWMDRHLARHSWVTTAAQKLTQMGNNRQSQLVTLVAGVVLAVWWFRRRPLRRLWWLPPTALIGMNLAERFGQLILAKAVNRGHPPARFAQTLGTYPSGGSARVVCIWGSVGVLIVVTASPSPRCLARAVGALVAASAFVEGCTRTYLLKHWVTDVVGGWLFGALLLAVFAWTIKLIVDPPSGAPAVSSARAGGRAPVPSGA